MSVYDFDIHDINNDQPSCSSFIRQHLREKAQAATELLMPKKSKDRYMAAYKAFIKWQEKEGTNSFSEEVMLAYFSELTQRYKPSSLWSIYSMVATVVRIRHNVDPMKYPQLKSLARKNSKGYVPKKSKVLSTKNV